MSIAEREGEKRASWPKFVGCEMLGDVLLECGDADHLQVARLV